MNAADIAKALSARELSTGGWIARCPAHDDHNPSLSISEGDGGKPLVFCHAGCDGAVIDALRDRGLWVEHDAGEIPIAHGQLGPYTRYWDYHDVVGVHVLRVCRWDINEKKEIRPLSFQAGKWTWKQLDRDRPLYRLPALLADKSKRVLVVEGEKTADAAQKYFPDLAVTTWAGGAKAISKTDWRPIAGRDVTLFPDNDDPGRKAMDAVANILRSHGCTVRRADVSKLGELPEGWDIADALGDRSFDLDALWDAVMDAPIGAPSAKSLTPLDISAAEQTDEAASSQPSRSSTYTLVPASELMTACSPPEFVVGGIFEENIHAGVVAPPESGKSLFVLNVGACVATGHAFHGHAVKQGLVVYLAGEGHNGIKRRLQAIEHRYHLGIARAPLVVSKAPASFIDPVEVLRVREAIAGAVESFKQPLRLLIIDTVIRYLAPGDDNKAQDMAAYLAAVDALRGEATAISCHHPGHADATRARGSSNWKAGLDAEYSIGKEGDVITVTCQKMKDGDRPAPFSFRIEQAPTLAAREDGSPVMSVVIAPTDAIVVRKPTGKNQKNLLVELERRHATGETLWTEKDLREIGRDIGMHKNSARDAVLGLRQLGYLTDTVGGSRLAHGTESTKQDRKHDFVPDERTENAPVSIDTVLSSRPSVQEPFPAHGA